MRTILPLLASTAMLLCWVDTAVADTPANKKHSAEDEAAKKGVLVRKEAIENGFYRVKLEHKTASPDGKLFAGYYPDGWDEVISIHDAATGKQIKRIVGHGDDVKKFKFTQDGRFLASRCVNSGRKGWALWDVSTGKLMLRLRD